MRDRKIGREADRSGFRRAGLLDRGATLAVVAGLLYAIHTQQPPPAKPDPSPQVRFSEICIIPPKSRGACWVEIKNDAEDEVNLKGYTLWDLHGKLVTFDSTLCIPPSGRGLVVLGPDENSFTRIRGRLIAGMPVVFVKGVDPFPPYFGPEKWEKQMVYTGPEPPRPLPSYVLDRIEARGGFPRGEDPAMKVCRRACWYTGSTLYLNELSLVTPTDEIAAFVRWGDFRGLYNPKHELSDRARKAEKAGLMRYWLFPETLAHDLPGTVVQAFRDGSYVVIPYEWTTPGRPARPFARPVSWEDVAIRWSRPQARFEAPVSSEPEHKWGWTRRCVELWYDSEMTNRALFFSTPASPVSSSHALSLRHEDVVYLSGRLLHFRVGKQNEDGRIAWSPLLLTQVPDRPFWDVPEFPRQDTRARYATVSYLETERGRSGSANGSQR